MVNNYNVQFNDHSQNYRALDAAHAAEQFARDYNDDHENSVINGDGIELIVKDDTGSTIHFVVTGEISHCFYANEKVINE